MEEECLYIGAKLIKAVPMSNQDFKRAQGVESDTASEEAPGYRVTYEDGYVSWSPKETFERAYRKVSDSEKALAGV